MGFIFALSSIPGKALAPMEFPDAHLIAHSLLYSTLYLLGYVAFRHQNYSRFLKEFSLPVSLVLVMLYGASDEFHQSFTPGRTEEFKDFMIDVIAAAVMLLIIALLEHVRSRRRKPETS